MNHLKADFGVTALLAGMVILGCFSLLWKGVGEPLERELILVISNIVGGFIVYKATKKTGGN